MKSIRKAKKIILNNHLINELKKKDDKIIMMGSRLDKANLMINSFNKEMISLAEFMKMENVDKLSMIDVLKEVKNRL